MENIKKTTTIFVLFLILAALTLTMGSVTSARENRDAAYASNNLRYLPGTPPLKNGYEATHRGVEPVIEKTEPRLVAVN